MPPRMTAAAARRRAKTGGSLSPQEYRELKEDEAADGMTEAVMRDRYLKGRARERGLLLYWTWNSIHSPKGFPDLTFLHPGTGRMLFVELKSKRGRTTPEQDRWLAALGCAQEATGGWVRRAVWRPADLFNGVVDAALDELSQT